MIRYTIPKGTRVWSIPQIGEWTAERLQMEGAAKCIDTLLANWSWRELVRTSTVEWTVILEQEIPWSVKKEDPSAVCIVFPLPDNLNYIGFIVQRGRVISEEI